MGPRLRRTWTLVLLGLSLTACGDESPPAACSRGAAAVRSALVAAPGPVRVAGTPISTCVKEASDADELQAVGAGLVGAAAGLSDAARRRRGGRAELRLGYLVGSARRGAGREGGERAELLRRLEQEAQSLESDRAAYRRGVEAGRRSG